jgi:hypothetical protein
MSTAEEILGFHFSPIRFSSHAEMLDLSKLTAVIDINVVKLKEISERLGESTFEFTADSLVQKVCKKFNDFVDGGPTSNAFYAFDKRECKALAFALDYKEPGTKAIIASDLLTASALSVLEKDWRNSYLTGIVLCCLKNWGVEDQERIEKLRALIAEKLQDYKGSRTTLLSLKKNLRYFVNRSGDVILGSDFALNGSKPANVCSYLGVPSSWISYSYFKNFILAYFEKRKADLSQAYDDIEEFIRLHNNHDTTIRAISKVIIQADSSSFSSIQDRIQKFALKHIGDPAKSQAWNHTAGMDASQISEVQQAKTILNKWITKRFINVFFDTCLNDPRRKAFWLRYSERVETFRVFGPSTVRRQLQADNRIAEFVPSRFQATTGNSRISAFVMVINDYKLIEFSDLGHAFYAYKRNNGFGPDLENTRYVSVSDFVDGNMPFLVYRNGYNLYNFSSQGRLSHSDGDLRWEQVFETWINNYV